MNGRIVRVNPVVCFAERLCQLLGDVLMSISMKPGRVERQNYHYKSNGTCLVLMAVETLAGCRVVTVTERKTKNDYAEFMKVLAAAYPDAYKIVLVQDNLGTHNPSSFYRKKERLQKLFQPLRRLRWRSVLKWSIRPRMPVGLI